MQKKTEKPGKLDRKSKEENFTATFYPGRSMQNQTVSLTLRASVSSFRIVLVSLFPLSASVSRWGRPASVGSSSRKASSVSSVKPSSRLTTVAAWRCRCEHRRSMSRVARGMPDRSRVPLDRGADSTAFRLHRRSKIRNSAFGTKLDSKLLKTDWF